MHKYQCSTSSVPVQYQCGISVVTVRYRYSTSAVPVEHHCSTALVGHQCSSDTILVQYRCDTDVTSPGHQHIARIRFRSAGLDTQVFADLPPDPGFARPPGRPRGLYSAWACPSELAPLSSPAPRILNTPEAKAHGWRRAVHRAFSAQVICGQVPFGKRPLGLVKVRSLSGCTARAAHFDAAMPNLALVQHRDRRSLGDILERFISGASEQDAPPWIPEGPSLEADRLLQEIRDDRPMADMLGESGGLLPAPSLGSRARSRVWRGPA